MNQEILELLAEKKYSAVKQLIGQMEEADLAKLFEELENEEDADQFNRLFRLLPKETAAEVFSYMEPEIQEKIVRTLTDTELQHILDDLFMDDYVDLVEEMPANVVKRVMQNTTPANRKLINQYLKYPEDSAGSLMTNEYVYFRSGITVAKAFEIIREYGVDKETIYTCYVTSSRKELLGVVTVREMLLTAPETIIDTLMDTNPIHVHTHDDQEEIAKMFSRYDMLAMPVVDSENRIVGIITIDDAVDVIQDENTEDFEKMAGMTPSDDTYLRTPVITLAKHRIIWLMVLMLSAMVTGSTFRKLADHENSANAWGPWDPKKFTVEDSAFGFIKMKNGATIYLEASWALNTLDVNEAKTILCGDKGGADMLGKDGGLRINGEKYSKTFVTEPDLKAGGVAFYDGTTGGDPAELEARAWIAHVLDDSKPLVTKPEQAYVVTQILEAIYRSAETNRPVYFENGELKLD